MDPNPEFAQPSNMVPDQAILLLLGEGWCLTVMVWLPGSENHVSELQDGVSYGYQRGVLLAAGFGGETPEFFLQEAVFLGRGHPGATIAVRFQDQYVRVRRCAQPIRELQPPLQAVAAKPPKTAGRPKRKPDWMNNFSLRAGPSLRQAARISNARS